MKNILLLILFITMNSSSIFIKDTIDGIFYHESGIYLKIENKSFKLIMPNNAINGWYSEIMAEGTIKQIDNCFIELNTDKEPVIDVLKSIKIRQQRETLSMDSIKVRFLIPYQRGQLKISILTNTSKTYELDYSNESKELSIPSNIQFISLSIEPKYITSHFFDGLFYGVLCWNSIDYPINNNINFIEIEIPAIDDSFFETYYVKGDYARVMNDSIIWKGEVYVKSKK